MPEATRSGAQGLVEDLQRQRRFFAGRVPAYDRILSCLEQLLPGEVGERLDSAWRERAFFAFSNRPLLLLAVLRFDALLEGPSHPLWAALALPSPDPGVVRADSLASALSSVRARAWDALRRRSVQTNETLRAVTWLWPAGLAGADSGGRPLVLVDLGASGGLNLVADALPPVWRRSDGQAVAVAREPRVLARLGIDREPIDVGDEESATWLRACIWAGDTLRLGRLEAALAAFRAAAGGAAPPVLERSNLSEAPARLARLASETDSEALILVYQTVVDAYLEPEERTAHRQRMHEWLASLPARRALVTELEDAPPRGEERRAAWIRAHALFPDGSVRTLVLARCDYFPVSLEIDDVAEGELVRAFRMP